jgi:hypothetical protein
MEDIDIDWEMLWSHFREVVPVFREAGLVLCGQRSPSELSFHDDFVLVDVTLDIREGSYGHVMSELAEKLQKVVDHWVRTKGWHLTPVALSEGIAKAGAVGDKIRCRMGVYITALPAKVIDNGLWV